MRLVERVPFGGPRPPRHDEMCLAIARRPDLLFPRFPGAVRAVVEAPVGGGFVDVLGLTDAPPDEVEAAIVEVKTRHENSSAGDVIRQIRWYRDRLPRAYQTGGEPRLVLVVEDVMGMDPTSLELVALAGIEVLPIGYFKEAA